MRLLRPPRRVEPWPRVLRGCPLQAHWLDGEPITDVVAMSGVVGRYRHFVVEAPDRPEVAQRLDAAMAAAIDLPRSRGRSWRPRPGSLPPGIRARGTLNRRA